MRAWMWCGIALGAAASLTSGGCSAPPKRVEAPPEYRAWKPDPNQPVSKSEDVFKIEPPPSFWAKTTKPVTTSATAPKPSIWNYRPGSLFFNKQKSDSGSAPKADLGNSLSRYFPGLQGRDPGAPLRTARNDRPGRLAPGEPIGGSVLASNSAMAVGEFQPTGNVVADHHPIADLPVSLKVETTPKPPSPSLPDTANLAKGDEPKPKEPTPSNDAKLTSLETPVPQQVKPQDSPEIPSLDLQIEPSSAKSEKPATTPAPKEAETKRADSVPPPQIPDFKPAESATSAPAPPADSSPPVAIPASETAAKKPLETPAPASDPTPAPSPTPEPTPTPLPSPELVPPGSQTSALDNDPVLKGRPLYGKIAPVELPPVEFPKTYHEQSIRNVLDINGRNDSAANEPAPTPKRWQFPRLSKLWKPKAEDDASVKRTSTTFGDVIKRPGRAVLASPSSQPVQAQAAKGSAVTKAVQIPDW